MDRLEGGIIQPRHMGLAGFVLRKEEPMATDLVMLDGEEIARPQPCGIPDQNPCRQQNAVGAGPRPALHGVGGIQPRGDLLMAQGRGVFGGDFDTPQWTKYTLVQVAFLTCETHQRSQHAAVVGDCGGSQMSEGIVQVGVDLVRRKVRCLPGQTLNQDGELLQVAGASADTAAIGLGQVKDADHGAYSQRRGAYRPWGSSSTAPQNRYNPTTRAASSVVYLPIRRLALWLAFRRWPIIRAGWLTLLLVGLALHRIEGVLALLVLGQFRQAWIDLMERRCPRTGRMERLRPTDGAFSLEVNG